MKSISYEQFCVAIQNAVQNHYDRETIVELHTVQKLNGVILKGITVSAKSGNIMPTLYLDKYYKEYRDGIPFEQVVQTFLEEYKSAGRKSYLDMDFFMEYKKVKSHLGVKLMHYEMNREFLVPLPFKRFLDLALVCFCDIRDCQIGHGAITIRKEHLEMWKISEEELFHDAMENMMQLYPADFINMAMVLKELYTDPAGLLSEPLSMYVLTNKERLNGAASLLYKGKMEEIAAIIGGDYYVLPSSIHEVIILPRKKGTDENNLSRMVNEINHKQVAREEILSNHAYVYHANTKELCGLPLIPYKENGSDKNQ